MKEAYYALYKGDKFIDLGTKKYLANLLNCKIDFITYLATPANRRRINSRKNKAKESNALIVIKIEEESYDK